MMQMQWFRSISLEMNCWNHHFRVTSWTLRGVSKISKKTFISILQKILGTDLIFQIGPYQMFFKIASSSVSSHVTWPNSESVGSPTPNCRCDQQLSEKSGDTQRPWTITNQENLHYCAQIMAKLHDQQTVCSSYQSVPYLLATQQWPSGVGDPY